MKAGGGVGKLYDISGMTHLRDPKPWNVYRREKKMNIDKEM